MAGNIREWVHPMQLAAMAVPDRPGLGMEPDYELLAQYRSG